MDTFYLMNAEGDLVTTGCRWTRRWDDARVFHDRAVAHQVAKALDLLYVRRTVTEMDGEQSGQTLYRIENLPGAPALRVRERDGACQLELTSVWLTGAQIGDCLEGLRMMSDLVNG